jgi:hypothetical protein
MKSQCLSGSMGIRSRGAVFWRSPSTRIGWALAIILGLSATTASADEFRYHYVSFTAVTLPPGFVDFIPTAIDDSGRVYGTASDASFVDPRIAVYTDGAVTVRQSGIPIVANARGTVGGYVIDPETGKLQAALFHGTTTQLIPLLPGEVQTRVVSLNDSNSVLVWSENPSGNVRNTYRLYNNRGEIIFRFQLPTGSDCSTCWGLNNQGIVVGTISDPSLNAFRAIRFRPPYREPQVLAPLSPDRDSASFAITNSGNVLGLSDTVGDQTSHRIGIWDRKGHFTTYFDGIFFAAYMNNDNLIVLTGNYDTDFNSYLVPRPGVRLNLEDLVDNPGSVEAPLAQVIGINNRGDIIGYGSCTAIPCPTFLLRRMSSRR